MKHIKLYEQFNNQNNIVVINQLINDKIVFDRVLNTVNSLPNKFKNILREYFSQKVIDINKLDKIEKRFNIFQKVKNLYNKGVKNINDIIDRIFPKNETIGFEILLAILIMASVVFIAVFGLVKITNWFENRGRDGLGILLGFLWAILVVAGFFVTLYALDDSSPKEKLKAKEEEISKIILNTGIKQDTIVLIKDKDGKYKIEIDESNW